MNNIKRKTAIVMSLAMATGGVVSTADRISFAENAQTPAGSQETSTNEKILPNSTKYTDVVLKKTEDNLFKVENVKRSGYFVVTFDKNDVKGYEIEKRNDKEPEHYGKESQTSFEMTTNSEYKNVKMNISVPGAKEEDYFVDIISGVIHSKKDYGNYPVDKRDEGDFVNDDEKVSFIVPFYNNTNKPEDAILTIKKYDSFENDNNDVKAKIFFVEYDENDNLLYRVTKPEQSFMNFLQKNKEYRGVPFSNSDNTNYTYITTDANEGANVELYFDFENDNDGDIDAKPITVKVYKSIKDAKDNDDDPDTAEPDEYTIEPSSNTDSVSFSWEKGSIIKLETEKNNSLAMKLKITSSGGKTVVDEKTKVEEETHDSAVSEIFKKNSRRVYGQNRYATAAKLSEEFSSANTAIIVSGENYPDAISAGPLATSERAPILMVKKDEIPKETEKALEDLKVKRVIVVGGSNSVSDDVYEELEKSYDVKRIAGANRYYTSLAVAKEYAKGVKAEGVVFASGKSFADALSITPVAGIKHYPIILVDNKLDNETHDFIKRNNIENNIIVGGFSSVNRNIENSLKGKIERVSGYDRYDTSAEIANKYFGSNLQPYLASGENYPDSLAAGSIAAINDQPLLLTKKNTMNSKIRKIIEDKAKKINIVGGYSSVGDMAKILK